MNDKIFMADLPEESKNYFYDYGIRLLCYISFDYSWVNFLDNYTRTKKVIFEPISDICSLSLTIYNEFIFVYCGFFSNNYDNYLIEY